MFPISYWMTRSYSTDENVGIATSDAFTKPLRDVTAVASSYWAQARYKSATPQTSQACIFYLKKRKVTRHPFFSRIRSASYLPSYSTDCDRQAYYIASS